MSLKIWIDGKFYDKENAKLSVYDHGLLYGDGVFEGIRVYRGKIFACDAHLRRLFDSALGIRLTPPRTAEQIKAAMEEAVKINNLSDGYIRLVITRGTGYLGLNPNKCPTPTIFIIADTVELYPPETYKKGMSIITSSVVRMHPNSLSPRIKSLNYLNNILAKIEAMDAGVPEAVMLNQEGHVAECTSDNIFIVRSGCVQTPATADGILEGVTRQVMLELCLKLSIPCIEKTLLRHDLYIANECFVTGTAAEVVPVTRIDGRPVGGGMPGPITHTLMEAFHKHVRG
jgi:branched-chain amino acid aminotransferase